MEKEFFSNAESNKAEAGKKNAFLLSRPVSLTVILTRRCNLRCIMCGRVAAEKTDLSPDLADKLNGFLPYAASIDWQGGEVFLVEYFKELFSGIADRQPHTLQQVTTNGLLIDNAWAQILSQSNSRLMFSIDAVDKDVYEYIRVGAKFEKLIDSLKLLNAAKEQHGSKSVRGLNAVVMKCNYRILDLFPDFCKKYHFDSLAFNFLWPDASPEQDILIHPDPEAISYLKKSIPGIKELCRKYGIYFDCKFESRLQEAPVFGRNGSQNDLAENREVSRCAGCLFPWTNIHIEPDGKVKPACACARVAGDLHNNRLEEIWNGPVMQAYRRYLCSGHPAEICSSSCLTRGPE